MFRYCSIQASASARGCPSSRRGRRCASWPTLIRPARSRIFRCLEMAGWLMSNGWASSVTDASPRARRARMARLVGSASARNVASRRADTAVFIAIRFNNYKVIYTADQMSSPVIGSGAELAEVMVGVQIRPAQPGPCRHPAEDRMRGPEAAPVARRNALEQHHYLLHVRREVPGSRTRTLLVDLGARQDAGRPRQRQIQRGPLHDGLPERTRCGTHRLFTKGHPAGVREVADHLGRRHATPPALAVGPYRVQPAPNLLPAALVRVSLHRGRITPEVGRSSRDAEQPFAAGVAERRERTFAAVSRPFQECTECLAVTQSVELRTVGKRRQREVAFAHGTLQVFEPGLVITNVAQQPAFLEDRLGIFTDAKRFEHGQADLHLVWPTVEPGVKVVDPCGEERDAGGMPHTLQSLARLVAAAGKPESDDVDAIVCTCH